MVFIFLAYFTLYNGLQFVIARTWKQPRCPSADEWTRKLWYIYTMEYYSAIKKNSCIPFKTHIIFSHGKLEPSFTSRLVE